MNELTPQQRAELRAPPDAPDHHRVALGARLITARIRKTTNAMKPFAIACIRLQTFFRPPGFPGNRVAARLEMDDSRRPYASQGAENA